MNANRECGECGRYNCQGHDDTTGALLCASCREPQINADGSVVEFIGDYCESCHDRGRIEGQESVRNGDHDYSMNY